MPNTRRSASELTDEQYWLDFWGSTPAEIGPSRGAIRDFVREEWVRYLTSWVRPGERWLEIGCANSSFLYDFPQRLGARLDGVDIAPEALARTRSAIAQHDIDTSLTLHDYREIRDTELGKYDGAISYGFVEHFGDCAETHRHIARYVREGGLVVSIVPNMTGLPGLVQQFCDEPTFLTHNILTPETLKVALADAGIDVLASEPVMGLNMAVINPASRSRAFRLIVNVLTVAASRAFALLQLGTGWRMRPRLWRSPYTVAVGRVSIAQQAGESA